MNTRPPTTAQLRILRRVRDERIVACDLTSVRDTRRGTLVSLKHAFLPLDAENHWTGEPELHFRSVLRCEVRGWLQQNPDAGAVLTLTAAGRGELSIAGDVSIGAHDRGTPPNPVGETP